ncbi:protein E18C [Proboscivirus elephantidbeta4]|uniref:Protein E18C n=2 Tax=Elephant endotheliotropic herpesvirus 4 TaxID=548914 RepID=A0A0S1TQS0_9BETA|nr:protein E18C [Elephant endotheliotropic herpesvirus 4]ALM26037.1 protein E18C [Elephant endotheliotropic herpesvirus 4]ALN42247.1 protein E18C [Elephant endotheliotropic herpesvirus 4A]
MVHLPKCELRNPLLTQYRKSCGYNKLRERNLWTMWADHNKRRQSARQTPGGRRNMWSGASGPLGFLGRMMVAGSMESRVVVWDAKPSVYTESGLL